MAQRSAEEQRGAPLASPEAGGQCHQRARPGEPAYPDHRQPRPQPAACPPDPPGYDIRSAAFRSLLLQRLQTLQFPDAWRGPGLEEIQDNVAPAHPVQREAFSAFILEDDVRDAVAAAAGNLGLQRMGSWCRR